MDLPYFRALARYNRWANGVLFEACTKLPQEEYFKTRLAFFKSIHGTLNHILLVDRIWLGRATAKPVPPLPLNQILYGDFLGLKVARAAKDDTIVNALDNMSEGEAAKEMTFTRSNGMTMSMEMRFMLGHMFNHATHHRGQVHDMLSQTALPPPSLDLFVYVLATKAGDAPGR